MSLLLAIHSYPGGNDALQRHWPYFQNAGASEIWTIGTEGGGTKAPEGVVYEIGANSYIDSEHLPNRMLNTLDKMLSCEEFDWLMLAEYDTLFVHQIDLSKIEKPVAAHLAGVHPQCKFYHGPWVMNREFAEAFVTAGRMIVKSGVCNYNSRESSPDVFFGLVCQQLGQDVQDDLWTEFSRNSYDIPGDLDEARTAVRNGVDVVHGIKHEHELAYILS